MAEKIRLQSAFASVGKVDKEKHVIYGVSAAQAVEALGHRITLDQKTLGQIAEFGNRTGKGIKSRYTHPGLSSDGMGKLLGRGRNWRVDGDKVRFDLHLVPSAFRSNGGHLNVSLGEHIEKMADEDPDMFGMSIVFSGYKVWTYEDGHEEEYDYEDLPPEGALTRYPVARIMNLYAVDAVDEPAANRDGMFGAFSQYFFATNKDAESAFADIDSLLEEYGVSPEKASEFASRYFTSRKSNDKSSEEDLMEEDVKDVASFTTTTTNGLKIGTGDGLIFQTTPLGVPGVVNKAQEEIDKLNKRLAEVERENAMNSLRLRLAQSGLSIEGQNAILSSVEDGLPIDKAGKAIDNQRAIEAKLREGTTVNGVVPSGRVTGMLTEVDQISLAVDAMFAGTRPPKGVAPLQGIRELYMKLSGDYEMTGGFYPENVSLAAVNTATMPGLVANAMNKRVVQIFQNYDHWWTKITGEGEHSSNLQDLRYHKIGGIGEMPTVGEGQAYTETEWADDYETAGWSKKGHYLGLTLEVIDKDDTRRLMLAPQALAQSAYLTLSKDVSRLFTVASGTGPLMRDGQRWFSGAHNNVGSSAFSSAALKSTILAMQKQEELGTGERIGNLTYPKYIMIPLDLQFTAVDILASAFDPSEGSTTSFLKDNVLANGETFAARRAAAHERLIVVPHWNDPNDWAAIANPALFPSVGLTFRFGNNPEIFSVSDPNSGLMFTNDTMPIKVRWFYSLGIIDHRGVYKHNVT